MSRPLSLFFVFLSFILLSFSAFANQNDAGVEERINHLIESVDPHLNIGVVLLKPNLNVPDHPHILFERNASHYYTLASSTKLISAIAYLDLLGPDFSFKTEAFQDPAHPNHLYLSLNGDPTLKSYKLKGFLNEVFQTLKNPHKIDTLYITSPKSNFFSPIAPGWMIGDTYYCYASPVHYGILDNNCLNLNDPLESEIALLTGFSRDALSQLRAPQNLDIYLIQKVRLLLPQTAFKNIRHVDYKKLPLSPLKLAEMSSPPLPELLRPILKKSKNLPTDALFQKIGEKYGLNQWGPTGEYVVKKLSQRNGLNLNGMILTDGSGLSRYNNATPLQTASLLQSIYYKPQIFGVLQQTLPIAAKDGTLRHRFSESPLKYKVHAKTGTMTGVSTLIGYIDTADNAPLFFSVMVNNFTGSPNKYKKLQESILEELYQHYSLKN